MRFKNNSQRKAIMAKLHKQGFSKVSAKYYAEHGMRPEELTCVCVKEKGKGSRVKGERVIKR